ncbi:oligosaccharide repeat unit polymerase [Hydrobacter penzbergensis]|uniref:Oligosaccharide repeat unit polymerase n=1 Tax=Hydrobacter penzbergensis TaxID=1235997 RepID=A0A8X8LE88_9BACT|nr:O-antigen polymerase [Hydrobacter penzbergensis]SDW85431.1 oligosaccharide repeat unit polymerase [Hydrobacter penzbergensis]
MKLRFDISRPDLLFLIVWALPFILLQFFSLDFFIGISPKTYWLVIGNVVSFLVIYKTFKLLFAHKILSIPKPDITFSLGKAMSFIRLVFPIWIALYCVTIIYSKGFPLLWILSGQSRTYDEFGVPTLSGFLNMVRAFLCVLCLIVWLKNKQRRYIYIFIFLIISAFFFEANRGGGLVLVLHPVGYYLFIKRFKLVQLFKVAFYALIFLAFLGFMEQYRYLRNDEYDIYQKFENLNLSSSEPNIALVYLLPPVLYVTTPVQNLNYLVVSGNTPNYIPFYSLMSLLPTVIRNQLIDQNNKDYGELLNETYNTTSFYTPFIRDFGITITVILVIIIQMIVSYVHIMAKYTENNFYKLLYPVFFMCIILSPFNLYFTSLVTVLYPFICAAFVNLKTKKT